MNDEPRGNWYLLTGLILGLAAGLALSLYFFPVRYANSEPSSLRADYRAEYRRLIAAAYQVDGNLPRAQARLGLLRDGDPIQALQAQAQRVLADGGGPDDARPLAELAAVLNGSAPQPRPSASPSAPVGGTPSPGSPSPPPAASPSPGAASPAESATPDPNQGVLSPTPTLPTLTPSPTLTLYPTFTPRPSATPPPVLQAPFSLAHQSEICDRSLPPGRIVVEVRDQAGKPQPGVRVQVAWEGGQDTFYTGLAPEISPGYADFLMTAGVSYTLRVGEAGAPVNNLTIPACGGSWKIEFQEGGH